MQQHGKKTFYVIQISKENFALIAVGYLLFVSFAKHFFWREYFSLAIISFKETEDINH